MLTWYDRFFFLQSGEHKIQQTMKPKFMSSTNSNGKSMVHIKNDNTEIMIGENTDKINQELFDSL